MRRALIVVDVQNDFCEGGSLAVAGGAEAAFRISELLRHWTEQDPKSPDHSRGDRLENALRAVLGLPPV